MDLPSKVVRAPEVRVAKRVGSARCEELAQHLDEGLRGLGLQVRLSQLPRAARALQLWSLFLEYAQAATQQGPAPKEVRKALEQVLVKHGFHSLREERSGQSGVALARWVLQSRSPEQVRQRAEQVAERVQLLTQGLRQPGLGAQSPRWVRVQGAVQLWSARVLAPVQEWGSRAREALQQASPRPVLVAVPPRAQARIELPIAQPLKVQPLKAQPAKEGQVELAAQNLSEGLRRIEVRAERVELPRPERIKRMWNAFLQHAQAAVAEGASPRRLREAFEPVLVRHGFQEMRDARTERSGVSAALWVLLGGTPEQVLERGVEVRLEPGAVEHRTQSELAATQQELPHAEGGRAREAQQAAEPARARWGWLPSWVPLEPALQLRPLRPGQEEAEPLRQGVLPRLRRGRSLLWGALERFRALPGQGALEQSEWNRKVLLAVAALLGLWVATTLLIYAL